MILYGRSIPSIAEQLNCETEKAQQIYDDVLAKFTGLKAFKQDSEEMARKYGYVTTVWGRKRRLVDMQLPYYEFSYKEGQIPIDFDPLADEDNANISTEVPNDICEKYTNKLLNAKYYKDRKRIEEELDKMGITIKNNTKKIRDATRQCVNCVDYDTEILTLNGWKKYNEISIGDKILSYNMQTQHITNDIIKHIYIYEGNHNVIKFQHNCFNAVSTMEHRWVTQKGNQLPKFVTTEHICKNKWPDYPILKIADNEFSDNVNISDDELQIIGWLMTDGSYKNNQPMRLYQSEITDKKKNIYDKMINTLKSLNMKFHDTERINSYHEIYLNKCSFTDWIRTEFPNRVLTYTFISSLSQHQSNILINSMLEGDGYNGDFDCHFVCGTKDKADIFQYLCCRAGIATNCKYILPDNKKHFGNVNNKDGYVITKQPYYIVSVLRRKRVHIYPQHRIETIVNGVWCVTTNNETWIARRNGCVFITGNSRVQGSAADLTKLAMIELYNNQELKDLGFKMLIPIHDEILAECPRENAKRCGELMEKMMIDAARDLIVPISCDAEYTEHWYGEPIEIK